MSLSLQEYNYKFEGDLDLLYDDGDFQSQGKVILCDDWNARVGNSTRPNYFVCDRFIDSIDDEEYLPDLPLQRLLDLCKSTSLRIANDRLGNECPVGSFTYSSRNGCSVIDYLILSQPDFSCINDFHVFMSWASEWPSG